MKKQAQHVVETPAESTGNAELTGKDCPTICPTLVKERPILFSGEMVRAILAGNKTQTRRVVKPQPPCECGYIINGNHDAALCYSLKTDPETSGVWWVPPTATSPDHKLPCPYGRVADRLWVRETWKAYQGVHKRIIEYRAGGFQPLDDGSSPAVYTFPKTLRPDSWYSPLFMPRWASRILLEITGVRCERLQDIRKHDAREEGTWHAHGCPDWWGDHEDGGKCPKTFDYQCLSSFPELWESINGKSPGKTWDDNPWVWVIEFKEVPQ